VARSVVSFLSGVLKNDWHPDMEIGETYDGEVTRGASCPMSARSDRGSWATTATGIPGISPTCTSVRFPLGRKSCPTPDAELPALSAGVVRRWNESGGF
jgi:hypothetical protein